MAYLSKQQVKDILDKAPPNLDKAKLVQSLAKQHTLEGYSATQPPKKSIGGFAGNVVKSTVGLAKNTAQAVIHPIETGKALLGVAAGAAEKVIPGQQEQEQNFDALVNFYKERYGSMDKLIETAYNDPAGFAADVATVAGGVEGIASKVGGLEKVAKVAGEVNKIADPLQAVTTVTSKVIPKSYLSTTAQKLYQSALKPSTTLSDAERAKILVTGLKEGIPVNSSGAVKLGKEMDALNTHIGKVIEQGKKAGDLIQTSEVVKYLDEVKKRVGQTINGKSRLDEIATIEDNFLKQYGETIPTDAAQQIKKNTYQVLRKSYGELKSTAIESEKAMARGIKEELVKKYPQLADLNARDSALINLDKALERAVARISNKDVVGLGTTVASTANPFAGILKALIDNPTVKSKIGIALQKAADRVPKKIRVRKPIVPATRLSQPARQSKE